MFLRFRIQDGNDHYDPAKKDEIFNRGPAVAVRKGWPTGRQRGCRVATEHAGGGGEPRTVVGNGGARGGEENQFSTTARRNGVGVSTGGGEVVEEEDEDEDAN